MIVRRRLTIIAALGLALGGCGGFGGGASGPDCVGLSAERCKELYEEAVHGLPPGTPVRSVQIRCTAAVCTNPVPARDPRRRTLTAGHGSSSMT